MEFMVCKSKGVEDSCGAKAVYSLDFDEPSFFVLLVWSSVSSKRFPLRVVRSAGERKSFTIKLVDGGVLRWSTSIGMTALSLLDNRRLEYCNLGEACSLSDKLVCCQNEAVRESTPLVCEEFDLSMSWVESVVGSEDVKVFSLGNGEA
jgi:hypothetical protein